MFFFFSWIKTSMYTLALQWPGRIPHIILISFLHGVGFMVGSSTGWTGILEILDGIFAFGFVYSGSFCSDMLLYIFPARFIHTFCWMEHVRRMEGVVYRFFSFCIVAFSKYMAYAFLVILIYFPSSDSGFLSIECYFDIQIHLASRQCSTKSRKKKVQIFKTQDPEAIYINLIRKFLAKPRNQKKPPNQIPSTQ